MESESKSLFDRKTGYWFRGIAIVMVILSHYAEWWEWFPDLVLEGGAEDFRLSLSKLGIYGVNIFFFFSGYGLTKAAENKKIGGTFIWHRIRSVYLPYLIIVGIIQILYGGFASASEFVRFLYGHEYWFMVVLFLFYIGFILIWAVLKNVHLRVLLFLLYTFAIIKALYDRDMQSFWYVSNLAFPLGILVATYETGCGKVLSKAKIPLIPILLAFTIYYERYMDKTGMTPEQILHMQLINTVLWTIQIACLAALIPWHDPIFAGLGKCSLYLYLMHTFIFMRCVNYFTFAIPYRFLVGAVITVAAAVLFHLLVTCFHKVCNLSFFKRYLK